MTTDFDLKPIPLSQSESKMLKARVYDLSEIAAKQALYGIIDFMSTRVKLPRRAFEEIIDDAVKYNDIKKKD